MTRDSFTLQLLVHSPITMDNARQAFKTATNRWPRLSNDEDRAAVMGMLAQMRYEYADAMIAYGKDHAAHREPS